MNEQIPNLGKSTYTREVALLPKVSKVLLDTYLSHLFKLLTYGYFAIVIVL
jgi:hypothetical protein